MIESTVTGQRHEEEVQDNQSEEIGPKTTGSGPIPPYLPSGTLEEFPKDLICD